MIWSALKYLSYLIMAILVLGFPFGVYRLGEMHGKIDERLNGENVVLMSDCKESTIFTHCKHTYVNSALFVKIYEDLQKELKAFRNTDSSQFPSSGSVSTNDHPLSSFKRAELELGLIKK